MAFYKWADLEADSIAPKHSTACGPTICGEQIEVGLLRVPANTSAKPNAHPNEQFMVVLKGRAKWTVGDEEKILGPGEVVHNPPHVQHGIEVLDEELEVIDCKTVVKGRSVKHAKWEDEKGA